MPDLLPTMDNAVEALANGLETMAFISLMPAEAPFVFPADAVRMEIDFSGPSAGTLVVCTSRALGQAIAIAVTGEPEPSISAEDALKELMNIVCGSLLRQEGMPIGFSISLPRVSPSLTDEEWSAFTGSAETSTVDAEGTLIAIRVQA